VGADVASIVTFRAIAGSGPVRVMVPFIPKLMRVEFPAGAALAELMAARREPAPVSPRLVTVIVCEYAKAWVAEAWATADPAGKATAAETPATKQAAPAIRGMKRLARIISKLINATCMTRENIIRPTSVTFGIEDLQHQEVCAVEHAAKPRR
jgi:hypothetical protein